CLMLPERANIMQCKKGPSTLHPFATTLRDFRVYFDGNRGPKLIKKTLSFMKVPSNKTLLFTKGILIHFETDE
ncbi:hypothetical protein D7Z54_35460, partial [Salibacterium salarium]